MDVIIDTDPGGDDAIALMWLASLVHQGRLSLLAVSTAAGNVGAGMTFRNASGILAMCRLEHVPIGIGKSRHAPRDAAKVHGEDGIGGLAATMPGAPDRHRPAPESTALLSGLLSRPGDPPYVLAIAPLTNLAQAEVSTPGVLGGARDLIVMGGALGPGNITLNAEFNFHCDPASAASVLAARKGSRLVTLDISQSLRLTEQLTAKIVDGHKARPAAQFFDQLCRFMSARDARLNGNQGAPGFPAHDAATVAWLAYPELFESRVCRIAVDVTDHGERGRLRESADESAACWRVASRVAVNELLDRLADDLRILFARP